MNELLRITFLTCLLVFSINAFANDVQAEIEGVLDYFAEMWNEGDLESLRGYYHKDFVLVTSNGTLTRVQRLADLNVIMTPGTDHGELSFSDVQIQPLGDNHALAYGRSRIKFKDGTELASIFSTVYVKTPFGWKSLHTQE